MRKRRKLLLAAVGAAVAFVGGFIWININLRPVLVGLSCARVQSAAARAMNEAILEIMSDPENSEGLIEVRDTGSKVYLLQANSARLNALAAVCANSAQERIAMLGEQGISVPLGTISGVPLLVGKGPKMSLRFTPAGAVSSSFESEFRSAGINQTLHRINLELTATVRVILPGGSNTVTVTVSAPIAENIIVGDVPEAYTNVANEADLLNLVPEA